jgi:hypothetical protein
VKGDRGMPPATQAPTVNGPSTATRP